MTRSEALKELVQLPAPLLDEVLEYARFLSRRLESGRGEAMILAEPALSRDWLRSEEDEAWRDL